ncbi:hypothetical protein [Xanthomonas phage Xp15]|uniref:Uncharacterized protein n=1 Tax=Xanthomonas phage Xp15 TaxID=322855 RepID=Q52PR2_9CAUD|nr:hypothetical protein XPXV15_gp60 [Xanthomonas phage Xp15]AAX84896.1 hypothetical protein [Xanthomonas phage Xp15]
MAASGIASTTIPSSANDVESNSTSEATSNIGAL